MPISFKRMLLACTFALPALFSACLPSHAESFAVTNDVKVQVNDSLVQFSDAQPFLDGNVKLQVPLRRMVEHLGYNISWAQAGSQIAITLQHGKTNVSFTTGSPEVVINGKSSTPGFSALLMNGSVYVPFRLISDSFGIKTQWDAVNRIAILGTDGNYHAPAWYRPTQIVPNYLRTIDMKASAYTASPSENGGFSALDFMGNALQLGTIAVDPSVIPLGSKVYVEGYTHDGLPTGGMYAIASDTGGSVKGNHIDIFVPQSQRQAATFGIQQVKVYVLGS